MRAGARFSGARGAGTVAAGQRTFSSGIVAPSFGLGRVSLPPGTKTSNPFTVGGFNTGCFGLECVNFFPSLTRVPPNVFNLGFGRFGFRNSGFGFGGGFNGLGSYTMGYYPGYGYGYGGYPTAGYEGEWPGQLYAQEQLLQMKAEDQQRLLSEMESDQRRHNELQRELADQRAADLQDQRDAAVASRWTQSQQPQQQLQPQQQSSQPATPAVSAERLPAVLVFRDHHTQNVQNYALTPKAVFEFTNVGWNKIPLTDLDLPATMAVNQERGVPFKVPGYSATPAP
jgi:hypothetical protein